MNFQWQLWQQIIGFNLTLDPGTQQQVVVLQICQENLVFVNAVYIFASLRRGGLELYLTLARGGSRLFVQISQETTNGRGRRGGQVGNAGREAGGEICNGAWGRKEEGGTTPGSCVFSLDKGDGTKGKSTGPCQSKGTVPEIPPWQPRFHASIVCGHSKPFYLSS